jgi:hypothetical protein
MRSRGNKNTTLRDVAATAVALLALGGCGGDATTTGGQTVTDPSTTGAKTELTIMVNDGAGKRRTVQLRCDPPGGDHTDPQTACDLLERAGERALPAVAKDQACTQIYGGPQTARITGSWRGKPVDARLSRTNGCEIARWDALRGLLPDA